MGLVPGLVKGLVVTGSTVVRTVFPKRGVRTLVPAPTKGAATVQYPHVKEAPPTRARGVIALHEGNCTACMLCARECPDWCIYIEG
ncbi:MAG: NADH-quinone oxidoreductase subunit I, partial [Acidimicrobiaceae bacterium]|nr:NADH-quinone oxidoreductase subunit I [Acidimicrobiaceae bacterium]